MRYATSQDLKNQHNNVFGPRLGPLYHDLYSEVCHVHEKWAIYCALFDKSDERIDILNEVSPYFFWTVQNSLLEDIILHLSRLTDPAAQSGRSNLSLFALPDAINDPRFDSIKSEISQLVEDAKAKTDNFREWRNKRIAHRDLTLALNQSESLPSVQKKDIEKALSSIGKVLANLRDGYCGTSTVYEWTPINSNVCVEELVYYLSFATWMEKRRKAWSYDGSPMPGKYDLPPAV